MFCEKGRHSTAFRFFLSVKERKFSMQPAPGRDKDNRNV